METITLTIRITPELKRQIEIIAKNEDRSINNLINIILKNYIKENGLNKKS
jgi:predicted HicB family RNase H-like nuclease